MTTKKEEAIVRNTKVKKCFIITPIGGDRSEIRDALDGLLKNVLEPVLLESGFNHEDIIVAHQMKDSGSINTQLITRIIEDELCIVNLTGLNPNVMYELAIRHAVGKPVVIIAEVGTKLPFDIVDQRTIFYHNTMLGAVQLKESLGDMIGVILSNPDQIPDNPIIKIIKDNAILDKIKSDGKEHSELSLILNKISNLEERVYNSKKISTISEKRKESNVSSFILDYEGDLSTIDFDEYWMTCKITPIVLGSNSKELSTNSVIVRFPFNLTEIDLELFRRFIEQRGVKVINIIHIENAR